jgi:DNA polymerase-3 subunit gamma/tau
VSSGPSLYRRHRPRTFDDVVGQEHVVRTLRNAVEQNKVHHAYLFVGSRGTGKTSMAKILASCLNCVNGPTVTPCGVCDSCVSIANATSLDVIEMDAASNNSVDDIRDLRERVAYAPVTGGYKVYILDEAHMLSSQAWNAFLKTLEEPPPNTIFVLATTEANKVLPTVVDRCHRFDFGRPTVEDIAGVISRVAAAESIQIGPEAVGLLARHATGSFRDALGTLEQLVTYSGTAIATDDVLAVLGVADQDVLFGALDAVAGGNARDALLAVHRVAESGRDLSAFARDLETHARELLVVQTLGEVPAQLAMTPDHDTRLAEQARRIPPAAVVRVLDLLAGAMKAVRDGADARTQLELALTKAAAPEVDAGTRALLARIERLESALAGGARPSAPPVAPPATVEPDLSAQAQQSPPAPERPAPAPPSPPPVAAVPEPEPAPPAPVAVAEGPADLGTIQEVWPAVLDSIKAENMALAMALAQGRPVELDGKELIVAFRAEDSFKRRKAESQAQEIGAAVREMAGASVRMRFEERELADDAPEAQASPEDLINRLKSEFDAEEIIPDQEPSN